MAIISGSTSYDLLNRINERRQLIGLKKESNLHLTLVNLILNKSHSKLTEIFNPNLYEKIQQLWISYLYNQKVILKSNFFIGSHYIGKYALYGNHFVRLYDIRDNNKKIMKQLRLLIYDLINREAKKNGMKIIKGKTINNFLYFDTVDKYGIRETIYALDLSMYGNNWSPHISIFNLNELNHHNSKSLLIKKIINYYSIKGKQNFNAEKVGLDIRKILMNGLIKGQLGAISELVIPRDTKKRLLISLGKNQIVSK